jgi:uncharacterized protein (TIGR02594 family)
MKWMEMAWAEQGVAEIEGPDSNPKIIAYFKRAGRGDVTSEDIPWCGAFVGACLAHAGLPIPPNEDRLLARAYLKIGTAVDEPRNGAIVVFKRDDAGPFAGHVGFVTGWTDTHIAVLGGNQANAVNVRHYARSDVLGFRWPEPPATAHEMAAAGSRIVTHAQGVGEKAVGMMRDGGKAIGALVTGAGASAVVPTGQVPVLEQASGFMTTVQTAKAFGSFCLTSWPWIAGCLAVWWLGKMAVSAVGVSSSAGVIVDARLEDNNTGATP